MATLVQEVQFRFFSSYIFSSYSLANVANRCRKKKRTHYSVVKKHQNSNRYCSETSKQQHLKCFQERPTPNTIGAKIRRKRTRGRQKAKFIIATKWRDDNKCFSVLNNRSGLDDPRFSTPKEEGYLQRLHRTASMDPGNEITVSYLHTKKFIFVRDAAHKLYGKKS